MAKLASNANHPPKIETDAPLTPRRYVVRVLYARRQSSGGTRYLYAGREHA